MVACRQADELKRVKNECQLARTIVPPKTAMRSLIMLFFGLMSLRYVGANPHTPSLRLRLKQVLKNNKKATKILVAFLSFFLKYFIKTYKYNK